LLLLLLLACAVGITRVLGRRTRHAPRRVLLLLLLLPLLLLWLDAAPWAGQGPCW
jgi:hypothetical protein